MVVVVVVVIVVYDKVIVFWYDLFVFIVGFGLFYGQENVVFDIVQDFLVQFYWW